MKHRNDNTDPSKRAHTILEPAQLQEPADLGIRRVTLSLLWDASAAGLKLRKTATRHSQRSTRAEGALHDFRVAMRRLRSWIRAFRRPLRGSISRRKRRRLDELFHATSTARDASVHFEWVREQRESLDDSEHAGYARLKRHLMARRRVGWAAALSAAKRFERMGPSLVRDLESFHCSKETEPLPPTGVLIGRQLVKISDELRESLTAIERASDERPIHRARINAKRLRYVAEPVARMVPEADVLMESLEHLQDMLGDLHDAHVLAAEMRRRRASAGSKYARARNAGIRALKRRLRERRTRAFALAERTWLHGRAAPFFLRVHEMAGDVERLARIRSPRLSD